MKSSLHIALTALAAAILWMPLASAQTLEADTGAMSADPQLQTDAQRQVRRNADARPAAIGSAVFAPVRPAVEVATEESSIAPQMQTDGQRQAERTQRVARQRAIDHARFGRPVQGETYGEPIEPYAAGSNRIGAALGTAMAVDVVDAAAGMATNRILRSDDEDGKNP